jgi:hypothetical protein
VEQGENRLSFQKNLVMEDNTAPRPSTPSTNPRPSVPGLPARVVEALTAPGPDSTSQDEFGPGDVLTNPFGGLGDNPNPPGVSLVEGYPSSTIDWDARSVMSSGSRPPPETPPRSPGKSIRKKLSTLFDRATGKRSRPVTPTEKSSGKQPAVPEEPRATEHPSYYGPQGEEVLVASKFASRGPPAGQRTSALASSAASGESKKTGAGPLPVGAPVMDREGFLELRVADLEVQVANLASSLQELTKRFEMATTRGREDREASNRIVAGLRAQVQDAVGSRFVVPALPVTPGAPAPSASRPLPAAPTSTPALFKREKEFY